MTAPVERWSRVHGHQQAIEEEGRSAVVLSMDTSLSPTAVPEGQGSSGKGRHKVRKRGPQERPISKRWLREEQRPEWGQSSGGGSRGSH